MDEIILLTEAVSNLVPKGTQWTVRGANIPDDIWCENEADMPTKAAIKTEMDRLQAEYNANQYQRDRQYPSIGDQLDMQYHDQLNGTTTWKDAVAKVKADNPKK
jgi:hypothetical protein